MYAYLSRNLIFVWFPDVPATTRANQVILRSGDDALPLPIVMFSAPRIEDTSLGIALLTRMPPSKSISLTFPEAAKHAATLDADYALKDLLPRFAPSVPARLLRHILETVPSHFRESGPDLVRACVQILDHIQPLLPSANCAVSLPSGKLLAGIRLPGIRPPSGAYRVEDDGVMREAGPICIDGPDSHWLLDSIAPSIAGVGSRLVGIDGGTVWQLPLSAFRPRHSDILFSYLENLKQPKRANLIRALDRWRADTSAVSPDDWELVEDCRVLHGGITRDPQGAPLKSLDHGIDHLVPLPGGGVLVKGWLFDPYQRVESVEVTDASGASQILPRLWPARHDEAARHWDTAGFPAPQFPGFVSYVASGAEGPWQISLRLKSKTKIEVDTGLEDHDPRRTRDAVLKSFAASAFIDGAITQALGPAVERLHRAFMAQHPKPSRVQSRVHIGGPPESPSVSIIIPVYRNLNFLGFQFSALARSDGIKDAEIIYVLDSPEQAGFLEGLLRGDYLIHGLPVTMAVHSVNLGFAAAANTGAHVARADTLVFLNSDVVPSSMDWLQRMRDDLRKPNVGVVGPKLLYLDDSLQFAGMYFEQDPEGVWYNRHFMKGYPGSHAAANEAREVPAVTGACLMVTRKIFAQLDGFDENFVIGDFEDSDLCIRLVQAGYTCWYQPAAVLYHIERQSVEKHDAHGNSAATMVNRWRQHRLWATEIELIMADSEQRWNVPPGPGLKIERLE